MSFEVYGNFNDGFSENNFSFLNHIFNGFYDIFKK